MGGLGSRLISKMLRRALTRWGGSLSQDEKRILRDRLTALSDLDCTAYGIKLYIDSPLERDTRAKSCAKEPMTVRWIQSELRSGDVLYDVGANVGPYSLIAAKVGAGAAKVYAFEPSFVNFHQLCRNILLNGCEGCVVPLPIPVCERTRLDLFHYHSLEAGGALHSFSRAIDYKAESFEPLATFVSLGISLDDLVRIPGVARPTLMKIDVDGLEIDVLRGGSDVLRDEGLRSLVIEINEDLEEDASAILRLLHEAGLVPVEKQKLHRALHNYIIRRETRGARPLAPPDVPLATERRPR
jgi:FkbM family methyltransferase